MDFCEFETSLIYGVCSGTARAVKQRKPVWKNKTKQRKRKSKRGGERERERKLSPVMNVPLIMPETNTTARPYNFVGTGILSSSFVC